MSSNLFLQPFSAALLAGLVGGIAQRYQLSSPLALVALCPCIVLVPGPHFRRSCLECRAIARKLLNARVFLRCSLEITLH